MVFPYDKRPRGRSQRHVPMHVAEQLARQRDRLMAEVQQLRRENDRLRGAVRTTGAQQEAFERELAAAELELRTMRSELEAQQRRAARAEEAVKAQAAQTPPTGQPDAAAEARAEQNEAEEAEQERAEQERADEVARLEERIEGLMDDLARVRRRAANAVSQAQRDERVRLLSGLGDVLDSIERALDMGASGPWREGMEGIRSQLLAFFRTEGARLLGEPGEPMDPRLHEAVELVDSDDFESGEIVRVERHGLELEDGTIARTAKVVVAR